MKLRDIIEAERYFGSDKKSKMRREPGIKDYIKFLKQMKEFEKFEKEFMKKEEKKADGLFPHWSVAKKCAFFTIAGPPLGIMYIGCIVLMVRGLALFVVGGH